MTITLNGLCNGLDALDEAIQELPLLTLNFYSYGSIMRRRTPDGGETEHAVSPEQLATTLAARIRFESGLLSMNTLYLSTEGVKRTVVEYRPPQKTALFLEGSESPVRVPLPGLLMLRITTANDNPRYAIYAVNRRPSTLNAALYYAPLPNIGHSDVCWGTVQKVSDAALASTDLTEDWRQLLGSPFTSHSVSGKSKTHPDDIRQKLISLEQRKSRVYSSRDLIKLNFTLADLLRKV